MKFFPLHAQALKSSGEYVRQFVLEQPVKYSQIDSSAYYLLQLASGIKKNILEKQGILIVRSIDANNFIVKVKSPPRHSDKWSLKHVNDLWKLPDGLLQHDRNLLRRFTLKVTTSSFARSLRKNKKWKGVLIRPGNVVELDATLTDIMDLITYDEVLYAAVESRSPVEESRVLDLYLSPNTINTVHSLYPQLDGTGMTISIRESGFDTNDIDLRERNIPSDLAASTISNHATDMATIAAGAGNSFVTGKGVAGNAWLTSSDFNDLLPDRDDDYRSLNAWVQNHAYGTEIETFYGTLAEAYDQSANRLTRLLHVFSSGNSGIATPATGPYAGISGYSNLTGNFKMAKNVLTIGAVDTIGTPMFFSSAGPAHDGRVKPELVAYSTQGSSNTAALVSGVAILLQQLKPNAESALLKAVMINSARDIGTPGPDFRTGFGNLDAYRTITNLTESRYFEGTVSQGEIKNFIVNVPVAAKNFKATLVWNDPAAPVNSGTALVNDLDLTVQNTETWLPWTLDATPGGITLPAERGADRINNAEQVSFNDVPAGSYTLSVNGYDIPAGIQKFYIAYQWDPAGSFEWTFPSAGDNIPYDGETGTYFFWRSTLPASAGRLEVSFDGGEHWNVIAADVALGQGYFRWQDVPGVTGTAQARFVVGSSAYPTPVFTISRTLQVEFGFNCGDSVMVQWPNRTNVSSWEILTLQGAYMEKIAETKDTFYVIHKDAAATKFFAIQPLTADETKHLRSPAFDYDLLGSGCFLSSLTNVVVPGEGIYLNAILGTLYGIKGMTIEREEGGSFHPIGTLLPSSRTVRFLDAAPNQGLNQYRVRISFSNDTEFVSEVISDYYLTSLPFVVFPNPVAAGSDLNVFSKTFKVQDAVFSLFRIDGTLVTTRRLTSDRETVVLDVAEGFYLFSIASEEGTFSGKIIVR